MLAGQPHLSGIGVGPTSILILQSIERCNLNCSYCYLPNRDKSGRMSLATVRAALRWVRENGLLCDHLEVLWHAGEPLLAGIDFYRAAHDVALHELPTSVSWEFAFQTNGTLINDEWADFFASTDSQIGVSVDGPREWHDARRRSWGGGGSFDRLMRGVECLKRHNVPFSTVTVLSRAALENPAQLYNFLCQLGSQSFGFNDEEQEGVHLTSEMYRLESASPDTKRFYAALYQLARRDNRYDRIREISKSLHALGHLARPIAANGDSSHIPSEMSDPFRIVSVDCEGKLSTFAPELLGHNVRDIGKFVFGDVWNDTLHDVMATDRFQAANRLIRAGIDKCRQSCKYYEVCGGGSPSNKYFENGRLDTDVTKFCQLSIIAPLEAVLQQLERERVEPGS